MILCIGVGVGVAAKILAPVNLKTLQASIDKADEAMVGALYAIEGLIARGEEIQSGALTALAASLAEAQKAARSAQLNALSGDLGYYPAYIGMRKRQAAILTEIARCAAGLRSRPAQTLVISELARNIAESYAASNTGEASVLYVEGLKGYFRDEALPESREEFEASPILFSILQSLGYFIAAKREFAERLSAGAWPA